MDCEPVLKLRRAKIKTVVRQDIIYQSNPFLHRGTLRAYWLSVQRFFGLMLWVYILQVTTTNR